MAQLAGCGRDGRQGANVYCPFIWRCQARSRAAGPPTGELRRSPGKREEARVAAPRLGLLPPDAGHPGGQQAAGAQRLLRPAGRRIGKVQERLGPQRLQAVWDDKREAECVCVEVVAGA